MIFILTHVILQGPLVPVLLDLTANMTAPYTPKYYYDELQGMADASGVAYQQLLRVSMFPEVWSDFRGCLSTVTSCQHVSRGME